MVKCSVCGKTRHNKKGCKVIKEYKSENQLSLDVNAGITDNIDNLTNSLNTTLGLSGNTDPETLSPKPDILSISHWKNSNTFKEIGKKISQIDFYRQNNCAPEICKLVELESKSFGTCAENLIVELFELEPRTSTQNDGVKHGKKIEIKTARYWTGTNDCKWQHIEPDYDYDIIIFGLLDFSGFKIWALKKQVLINGLKTKNILTPQGKQGYWMKKSDALPYLIPIHSMQDLDNFIKSE